MRDKLGQQLEVGDVVVWAVVVNQKPYTAVGTLKQIKDTYVWVENWRGSHARLQRTGNLVKLVNWTPEQLREQRLHPTQ